MMMSHRAKERKWGDGSGGYANEAKTTVKISLLKTRHLRCFIMKAIVKRIAAQKANFLDGCIWQATRFCFMRLFSSRSVCRSHCLWLRGSEELEQDSFLRRLHADI
jgi:hypothetical protein